MPYAVKFYAYIFVANVLVVVIVARWLHPIRLCGEPGLWSGVRLSDDCYRSVAVWTEGIVKTQALNATWRNIRMDVESVKDRQPFALTLAALDLAPFFIDGVDLVANEGRG